MTFSIIPLHLGTIVRKKANMVFQYGDDTMTEYPLISFLLVGKDGRKFLVDTGGSEPDGTRWMPYERPENQRLENQLKRHGTSQNEIEGIFFTHLHWDHAGNKALFQNAVFYAQKQEYLSVLEKNLPGFEKELVLKSTYVLLEGDQERVVPGISVLLTPGHSEGSQTVIVDTTAGKTALAGDLLPTDENVSLKTPGGGHYDLDMITASMTKVLSLGISVLPGHEMSLVK